MTELTDRVQWTRFWAPVDAEIDLYDEGYLSDQAPGVRGIVNANVVTIQELDSVACLVLFGEPGAGKSRALQPAFHAQDESASGTVTVWFNLASCVSEERLVAELFGNAQIRAWVAGTGHMVLALDSFDECRMDVPGLARVLIRELEKLPRARLRLRLASRPSVWPGSLLERLRELWSPNAVGVFKLAPLRRRDVRDYAKAAGLDVRGFMTAVRRSRTVPLARHPFTLALLVREFHAHGRLSDASGLFDTAIASMSGEVSPARAERPSELTKAQRVRVVERIAATALFSQRPFIIRDAETPLPLGVVTTDTLAGGYEEVDGYVFPVTPAAIDSALDTPFFTSSGHGPLSFSSQAFVELLTARYLHARGLSAEQAIMALVDPDLGRVFPQLSEVAMWLARTDSEFALRLLEVDCILLMRAAPRGWPEDRRGAVIERVLEELGAGRQVDSRELSWMPFDWFTHVGLADQLRQWIANPQARLSARRMAIHIAEDRGLKALGGVLVELVLNSNELIHIREQAVSALKKLGSSEERALLRSLTGSTAARGRLWHLAVEAMWPEHIGPKELFGLLQTSGTGFSGFGHFVREDVVDRLDDDGLVHGLEWARAAAHPATDFTTQVLFNKLVRAAIAPARTNSAVAVALVRVVLARLRQFQPILFARPLEDDEDESLRLNDERRRTLIWLVARYGGAGRAKCNAALSGLVVAGDFGWLLERLEAERDGEVRSGLLQTLADLSWAFRVVSDEPKLVALRELLARDVDARAAINIDAMLQQASAAAAQTGAAAPVAVVELGSGAEVPGSRDDALREAVDAARAGSADAWVGLHWMLVADRDDMHHSYDPDIVARDTWSVLSEPERLVVLDAAERFLHQGRASPMGIGQHEMYRSYAAFSLLKDAAPRRFAELPTSIWSEWMLAIVGRGSGASNGPADHSVLLAAARVAAPKAFIDVVRQRVREGRREGSDLYFLRDLVGFFDASLTDVLLDELDHVQSTPAALGDALDVLVEAQAPGAFEYALNTTRAASEDRAEQALLALMRHRGPEAWSTAWPILSGAPELGSRVLSQTREWRRSRTLERLEDWQLGAIYTWLAAGHPKDADLDTNAERANSRSGRLSGLMRDVMVELRERGTESSFRAVQAIQAASSSPRDHDWDMRDAEEKWLRARWRPLTPEYLRAWLEDPQRRILKSAADLLLLVEEQLDAIRNAMVGSAVQMLWNEGDTVEPKTEDVFRDCIRRELRHRMLGRRLVVNREVEVERKARLDLYVQAFSKHPKTPPFEVVLELKRSGNPELLTGMEKQLRDVYLVEGVARHGVYVVAWFKDRRRAKPGTFEEAVRFFAEQARTLSDPQRTLRSCVLDLRFERTLSIRAGDGTRAKPPLPKNHKRTSRARETVHAKPNSEKNAASPPRPKRKTEDK